MESDTSRRPSETSPAGQEDRLPLSATACVHFKVWILAKFFDADKPTFSETDTFQRFALFRAPIAPGFPAGPNQCSHIVIRHSVTKRLPQISPGRRIETAIPHPIGGDATPVAVGTKRRRRGRNNAKRRSLRQDESLRGS